MIRGLFESILIHGLIILLLLIGGTSFGTGRGPKTMSMQMSTFLVEEHNPGEGDAPAALSDGVQEHVTEAAPETEKPVEKKKPIDKSVKKPVEKPVESVAQKTEPAPSPDAVPIANEEHAVSAAEAAESSGEGSSGAESHAQKAVGNSEMYDGTGADGGSGTGAALGGGGSDGIFSLRDLDLVPKLLNNKKPEYPRYAKENRISGHVRLSFVVDKDGRVTSLEVVEASPQNVFESSAIAAASRWKFSPAKKGGKHVQARMVIVLRFNLEEY